MGVLDLMPDRIGNVIIPKDEPIKVDPTGQPQKILTDGEMSAAEPDVYIQEYDAGDEIAGKYYKGLEKCIAIHRQMAVFKDNDFYVVVLAKMEKLLSALGKPTLRHINTALLSCPKPNYQMNLYKYHRKLDALEELWLMSDRYTCERLAKSDRNSLDPEHQKFLYYYLEYKNGNLFRLMKKLNGEKDDTPELIKRRKD